MSNLSITIPQFSDSPSIQNPPVELLRDAARTLAKQTGGAVEGSVFTSNPGDSNLFRHTFYLRVRALNEYTYPLFYIWHNTDLYPAHLLMAGDTQENAVDCGTDMELRDKLQQVFASAATAKLVYALIAQISE